MIYLKLFLTFLEIGAVSFGGGYGMLALIREKVLLHGWLTEEALLAAAECYGKSPYGDHLRRVAQGKLFG